MDFREVDRKLCLIQDSRFVQVLDPEQKTQANAVLFCGYIDHTRGLTYEALGLVKWEGNNYELIPDTRAVGLKVHADSVDEMQVRPIEDKALEERFRSTIDTLSVYYRNEGLAGARALTELDPFRHPQHPDDVCALFLTPENRLERMWVQSELAAHAADGTLLIAGKLLNEPDNIPGLHRGAAVTLTVVETTRGKQCVGVPGMVALD